MRHIDIIADTLASVTGMPAAHFKANIMRGIAASGHSTMDHNLLRELTDDEANKHLKALSTDAARRGVLRWVIEAGVLAHANPSQRQRIKMYSRNEQN